MDEIVIGSTVANFFCVGDTFTVVCGDSLWNTFEFDNYRDALKKYEEVKGKGFCSAQLILTRVLKNEVTDNGNND